jgi:hypothetical protein
VLEATGFETRAIVRADPALPVVHTTALLTTVGEVTMINTSPGAGGGDAHRLPVAQEKLAMLLFENRKILSVKALVKKVTLPRGWKVGNVTRGTPCRYSIILLRP